jgi:hypothetical protein
MRRGNIIDNSSNWNCMRASHFDLLPRAKHFDKEVIFEISVKHLGEEIEI